MEQTERYQRGEGMGEGDNSETKGKGLGKENVSMAYEHEQQCGNSLGTGGRMGGGGQWGENWNNCNRITMKTFLKE